jgi:hypothetical protein
MDESPHIYDSIGNQSHRKPLVLTYKVNQSRDFSSRNTCTKRIREQLKMIIDRTKRLGDHK